jgi:dTDP-4-amino-4,6-dideoxygalactose transaminase
MPGAPENPVPLLDLQREIAELWDEINFAIQRVLLSGNFVLGPEVEAFESEAAKLLGVRYAVGLNSGTDALTIGLKALGIGQGDEVITTAFSFFATAEAILHAGALPVFIDINPETFNLDPDSIEEAITPRTRAIIPVHLYGNPAPMGRISLLAAKYGLVVLEDAAQAFGAIYWGDAPGDLQDQQLIGRRIGTLGQAAAFSFYPTKNLGAYGDGGLLTTDDPGVDYKARLLRNHGENSDRPYRHRLLGYNSRLDEIQAAILRLKLPRVDNWNSLRKEAASHYRNLFAGASGIRTPANYAGHIYHQYTIQMDPEHRNQVAAQLSTEGISTKIYYPDPLDGRYGGRKNNTPVANRAARSVLSIPIWPGIHPQSQVRSVNAISTALSHAESNH